MQMERFVKFLIQCLFISLGDAISHHPILIVVSYDAFRYDFFKTKSVPHMNELRALGTYADHLINVFPTKTFPNHHSIATGLYPEVHGVIGNSYFNATTRQTVTISYEMFHYNDAVVPIWRHNENLDTSRHSGVMMWPGGCYPYQGKNVTHCQEFQPDMDWFKRIDTVISWIKDPEKPANLVMVYVEEPDTHGHRYGIDSSAVNDLIEKLDNITFYLQQQLKLHQLNDKVNVIHLSDHGMVNVSPPNFINVTQYLTPNTYKYAGSTPALQFIPNKGFENEIYDKLKMGSLRNGHFKVYKKSEYLGKWHYANNPRSPEILVMADVGYALDDLILAVEKYAKKFNLNVTDRSTFGVHGYDNTVQEMFPFFMVRGPKIKTNQKVSPFNTVDLYSLFCTILELAPSENNGTVSNIANILINEHGKYSLTSLLVITAGGIFIALIVISCAAMIVLIVIKRRQSITTTAALNKRFPQTFQSSIEAQRLLEPEEA